MKPIFGTALAAAKRHGVDINRNPLPARFETLSDAQTTVMAFEAARELAHERLSAFDKLSEPLQDVILTGEKITSANYRAAYALRDECLAHIDELFEDADVLALPSAPGTAPEFKDGTGDPVMSRAWTLLGLPSITIPCGMNETGLPVGLQLAAKPGQDKRLLEIAASLEAGPLAPHAASSRGQP